MQFRYFLTPGFENLREIEIFECAKIVVEKCLNVKPGENVVILTDTSQSRRIPEALAMAIATIPAEFAIVTIKTRKSMYGPPEATDPPKAVAGALRDADAALLIGTTGYIWTDACQEALKAGTRMLTSPGISEDNFTRCIPIDYEKVGQLTTKVQDIMSNGKKGILTSPQGTNLSFEIGYPPLWPRLGKVTKPGQVDSIPTGIAQFAVKERTTNGVLVVDGAFSRLGVLREPIYVTVKDGKVIKWDGGFEARESEKLMKMFNDPDVYNFASISTGTNPNAIFTGQPNEDERVIGMLGILLGDNYRLFGGKHRACMYLVAMLTTPKLEIDGKVILEGGELLVKI